MRPARISTKLFEYPRLFPHPINTHLHLAILSGPTIRASFIAFVSALLKIFSPLNAHLIFNNQQVFFNNFAISFSIFSKSASDILPESKSNKPIIRMDHSGFNFSGQTQHGMVGTCSQEWRKAKSFSSFP